MILELQEPFKSLWNKGYLQIHEDGRKYVCLFNSNQNRTIISNARYLMCVKIGYILSDEFEVDHIDNDKTNDDIDNLQILTKEANRLKEQLRYLEEDQLSRGYHCAYCEVPFIITEREVNMRIAKGGELAFCSRSCAANYHVGIHVGINEESKQQIKNLRTSGLSSYKISEITGYARNTVMKYW